jgi:hypothetical protein
MGGKGGCKEIITKIITTAEALPRAIADPYTRPGRLNTTFRSHAAQAYMAIKSTWVPGRSKWLYHSRRMRDSYDLAAYKPFGSSGMHAPLEGTSLPVGDEAPA